MTINFDDPRLQEALDNLDIVTFLEDHNIDCKTHGKNIGRGFVGIETCPFCSKSNCHFALNIQNKTGSCFVCGNTMSPLKAISHFGKMSFKQAFRFLVNESEENLDVNTRISNIFNKKKEKKKYEIMQTDELPPNKKITIKDLKYNRYLKQFFKKRHLFLWHCAWYDLRIGIGKYKGTIIFPIYSRNKQVSYQWRSITKKKYHTATNIRNYIVNEDNITKNKTLIIVEGFLDFVRIDSFIQCYYKNKFCVITGIAKKLSKIQIRRLIAKQPKKITVLFDGDSWFDYYYLKHELPCNVDFVILPKNKDPGDLSWQEMKKIFKKETI